MRIYHTCEINQFHYYPPPDETFKTKNLVYSNYFVIIIKWID